MEWLRLRNAFSAESLLLITDRNPLEVARVDVCIVEVFLFVLNTVNLNLSSWYFLSADYVQLEANTVRTVVGFSW